MVGHCLEPVELEAGRAKSRGDVECGDRVPSGPHAPGALRDRSGVGPRERVQPDSGGH